MNDIIKAFTPVNQLHEPHCVWLLRRDGLCTCNTPPDNLPVARTYPCERCGESYEKCSCCGQPGCELCV